MNNSIINWRAFPLAATMAMTTLASQAAVESGYVTDPVNPGDIMVRSADGHCVRTSAWSAGGWMGKCNVDGVTAESVDAAPVPAQDPTPVAATPAPEPTPVVQPAVAQDSIQPEPTPPAVVAYVAPVPIDRLILPADTLFDIDKSVIKPSGKVALDELVRQLSGNERVVLPVGHTSNTGTSRHNMGLSIRRANAVKDYLVSQGVSADRIHPSGKGENYPVATNTTVAGRTQNRRVEIEVMATPKDAKW
jgi:OOP family OmpA-OmpF porin